MVRTIFKTFLKTLKWLFFVSLLLIIFISATGWYLLATDSGFRKLPTLINTLTPYSLTYDELQGHLFSEQQWRNFALTGPNINVFADSLRIDLHTSAIKNKRFHLRSLAMTDGKIVLLDSTTEKEKTSSGIPNELPQIELPIDIDIDSVQLNKVTIWQDTEQLSTIDEAELSAHYHDQTLRFSTTGNFTQGHALLTGELKTKDDYPLTLQGNAELNVADGIKQSIAITADQSLLRPNVTLDLAGELTSQITLSGRLDLKARALNLQSTWQGVDYQQNYQSQRGVLHANGDFDNFALSLATDLQAPNKPPINVEAQANVTDTGVKNAQIVLQLLGGEVVFSGDIDYSPALNWQGVLTIDDIVAQRYYRDIEGRIDGKILTSGEQTDGQLQAQLTIDALSGHWQGSPIHGQGRIVYANEQLAVDDLQLNLAGNTVTAAGTMVDRKLALDLSVKADHLSRLLPGIEGSVSGQVSLSETIDNPAVNANVLWQDLSYRLENEQSAGEKANQIRVFESAQGELNLHGALESMDLALEGQFSGSDIPQSDLSLTASIVQKDVEDIDLQLKTLDGDIHATGEVHLAPTITWNINAQVNDVQASAYVNRLDSAVTATITSQGEIDNGSVEMQTKLSDLSGQWQGQPLAGNADVGMEDGKLVVEDMNIDVGGNKIALTGDLNPQDLNIEFSIDGTDLSRFYPQLQGEMTGEGTLSGTANAPVANLQLQGNNVSWQDYTINALNVDIDSSMVDGGAFDNHIELSGVEAAGHRWQQILLDTNGTFNQHAFALQSAGGEVNVDLAAAGGFSAIDSWSGELQTLTITGYDLNWRMQNRTTLAISPEQTIIEDFCLADQYSTICLDLDKAEKTLVNYDIDVLDSRSFAQFIPQQMRIEPSVVGKGALAIDASGDINGNANITLTPGTLFYQPEASAPITLELEQGTFTSKFTNSQANMALDIVFSDAGEITGEARLSDFAQPTIDGQVSVNIPDIGEFQYFVPKVSELQGSVTGELRFSGSLPQPQVSGEIVLENGTVIIPEYATDLQNIYLRLSAVKTGQIDINGNIGTPEGDLTTQGRLQLSPLALQLSLDGENMLIADAQQARVVVSPAIKVSIDPNDGVNVTGEVVIPEARIAIPDRSDAVQLSDDVVILTGDKTREDIAPIEEGSPVRANVRIKLGDAVFFQAPQVSLRLIGGVTVIMLPAQPIKGKGVIEVENGIYVLYGQELDVRRGRITFTGDDISNPSVEVLALREVDDVQAGAQITGSAQNLVLTLTSDPTLPDSAILSYLLFGRPPDSAMDNEALLQTAASISLGGVFPTDLAEQTGLDVFDLGVSGLKAGKYLGEDLYVGVRSNFFTAVSQFVARYQFNDRLSAEATAQNNENAIDFLYEYETD